MLLPCKSDTPSVYLRRQQQGKAWFVSNAANVVAACHVAALLVATPSVYLHVTATVPEAAGAAVP
jgi:hypothetical protein